MGKIYIITGESATGKTTLVNLLTKLIPKESILYRKPKELFSHNGRELHLLIGKKLLVCDGISLSSMNENGFCELKTIIDGKPIILRNSDNSIQSIKFNCDILLVTNESREEINKNLDSAMRRRVMIFTLTK